MADGEHDDPAMFCSREIGRAGRAVMAGAATTAQRRAAQQTAEAKQSAERAQAETRALRASSQEATKQTEQGR